MAKIFNGLREMLHGRYVSIWTHFYLVNNYFGIQLEMKYLIPYFENIYHRK